MTAVNRNIYEVPRIVTLRQALHHKLVREHYRKTHTAEYAVTKIFPFPKVNQDTRD